MNRLFLFFVLTASLNCFKMHSMITEAEYQAAGQKMQAECQAAIDKITAQYQQEIDRLQQALEAKGK